MKYYLEVKMRVRTGGDKSHQMEEALNLFCCRRGAFGAHSFPVLLKLLNCTCQKVQLNVPFFVISFRVISFLPFLI